MRRGQNFEPAYRQNSERALMPFFSGNDLVSPGAAILSISPWQMMRRMQEDMDLLLNQVLSGTAAAPQDGQSEQQRAGQMQIWSPRVDVSEDDREWRIEAELPGVKQDDISIQVQNDALILRAQLRQDQEVLAGPTDGQQQGKSAQEQQQRRYYRSERRFGYFERVLPLPENVDEENIRADFRDGVLMIRLPKKAQTTQQQGRRIPIGGSAGQTSPERNAGAAGATGGTAAPSATRSSEEQQAAQRQ
jgi:HSP20 family protein